MGIVVISTPADSPRYSFVLISIIDNPKMAFGIFKTTGDAVKLFGHIHVAVVLRNKDWFSFGSLDGRRIIKSMLIIATREVVIGINIFHTVTGLIVTDAESLARMVKL